MLRNVSFAPYEYYHIYNRGVDKRQIFMDEYDYKRFCGLLYACNTGKMFNFHDYLVKNESKRIDDLFDLDRGETQISIGSYCLMPNHFHLLIRVGEWNEQTHKRNPVTNFLHKLTTSYSMYFNKKNERSGALFEGRFKAKNIDNDEYLKYLFAYINLNPVKLIDKDFKEKGVKDVENAKKYLNSYVFSSYNDLLKEKRLMNKILDLKDFPKYFEKSFDFEEMMNFYLLNGSLYR